MTESHLGGRITSRRGEVLIVTCGPRLDGPLFLAGMEERYLALA